MTYWALNAVFLTVCGVVGLSAIAVSRHRRRRSEAGGVRFGAVAIAVTVVALLVMTAVFDNVMIMIGLVGYDPTKISGVFVGRAPLEDFAYSVGALILLPSLWILLESAARGGFATLRALIVVSRPLSWVNTAFPFAAAFVLASAGGSHSATSSLAPFDFGRVDWLVAVVGIVYFLIPYNLAMYGINDVFDYESDLRNPRKGGVEGAMLDRRFHTRILVAVVATNVPFLVFLAVVGSPSSWLVLAVSVFAVIAYSLKGMRFKERPFLDSITSSVHFVSPAVFGLVLAGADVTPGLLFLLGAFFLWGMASHAFGAVQDVVADREGGIASIGTVIGARSTVRVAFVGYLLAGVFMLGTAWPGPLASLLVLPYAITVAPWWNVADAQAETANRGWRRFLLLNFVSGFATTMLLIWWVVAHGT